MELKQITVVSPKPKVESHIEVESKRLVDCDIKYDNGFVDGTAFAVQVRDSHSKLSGKSFYLSEDFDWILGRDGLVIVLVPLRKK